MNLTNAGTKIKIDVREMKMEERNGEICIGESRVCIGEYNILYETIVGNIDEKDARDFKKASEILSRNMIGKTKVLVDLSKAGKPSLGARKLAKEWLEHETFGKVALFGMHPVARVIASFMIGITRKKDIRFFKTREEALTWLKE